jgi:hypothetical protein
MANISQIQRGFVQFVDKEVAAAFDGWQRAIVGGAAGLLAANFPNLVKVYGAHPFVAALGLYDANSGTVNVDALYNAIVPKLGTEKIPLTIPKIGTIKMGRDEIDTLMKYIKEV